MSEPTYAELTNENARLREQLAVFDGDPDSFVTGYKDLESENERLREALRQIADGRKMLEAQRIARAALAGVAA